MSNANGHDTAGTILTGSYIEGGKPKNSSLDQYMAVERKLGAATRVTSIAVGVGDDGTQAGPTLSYGPGGAPLPRSSTRCRRSIRCSPATSRPTIRRRRRRRCARAPRARSVIDFVVKDIARIDPRLAAVEQQKLQQHLDSIRDIEKQFAEPTTTMGATCMPPAKPDAKHVPPAQRSSSATTAASPTSTRSRTRSSTCSRRRSRATSRASRRSSWRTCRTRATRSG